MIFKYVLFDDFHSMLLLVLQPIFNPFKVTRHFSDQLILVCVSFNDIVVLGHTKNSNYHLTVAKPASSVIPAREVTTSY